MNILVDVGLGALLVLAIAGIVLNFYYRPTVERVSRRGEGQVEPVVGWRRVVAMIVFTPMAVVVLAFLAINLRLRRRPG